MAVPTLPAPAMATFTESRVRPAVAGQCLVELAQRVVEHGEVQDVALLADELTRVEARLAGAADRDDGQASGCSSSFSGRPAHESGNDRSTRLRRPLASVHSRTSSSGSSRRRTWSIVQVTVATVGMPRRW